MLDFVKSAVQSPASEPATFELPKLGRLPPIPTIPERNQALCSIYKKLRFVRRSEAAESIHGCIAA